MSFGDDVSINHYAFIDGGGGLTVGSGTSIGNHSSVITGNHPAGWLTEVDWSPVAIGNEVWIGADVPILPGVKIGDDHAVVGAGSVVTLHVEASNVVCGVRARALPPTGSGRPSNEHGP